jgi:hypothetical protein
MRQAVDACEHLCVVASPTMLSMTFRSCEPKRLEFWLADDGNFKSTEPVDPDAPLKTLDEAKACAARCAREF